jgi:hypothetical protein
MSEVSLSEFASKVRAKNRISFGDVRRLQRDYLADGIGSREDLELLIGLDREIARVDSAWERWLVTMAVDFVVWVERPTGVVSEETAEWLASTLRGEGECLTKTGRLIAREVAQEAAAFENEALAILALATAKGNVRSAAPISYEAETLAA